MMCYHLVSLVYISYLYSCVPSSSDFPIFFFYCYGDHRDLHSFPTRRSSDLRPKGVLNPHATRGDQAPDRDPGPDPRADRKSTRLNSSHVSISYAVFCLKKKKKKEHNTLNVNEGEVRDVGLQQHPHPDVHVKS